MSKRLVKRVALMAVIFFLPFSFFYFFSLGSHEFGRLPFLGPENSGKPFVYSDFSFATKSGKLTKKELEGKIIIATVVGSGCPDDCDLAAREFRFMVYQELVHQKKFKDVIILSELLDTNNAHLSNMNEKMDVEDQYWQFYESENHFFWNVEMNGHLLLSQDDQGRPDKKFFPRSALLIDKSFHLRGFYDCSQTIEIKRLMDELRLLKKEYDKEKR